MTMALPSADTVGTDAEGSTTGQVMGGVTGEVAVRASAGAEKAALVRRNAPKVRRGKSRPGAIHRARADLRTRNAPRTDTAQHG
ncbi:MAG TPA: hypothetical protein VFZ17_07280 [Acidimicrobiia bacterium]|nr:hypothetical protein [Acidimicrobiia bacterium]